MAGAGSKIEGADGIRRYSARMDARKLSNKEYCGHPLPDTCPPDEADELAEGTIVYRLVTASKPGPEDFRPCKDEPNKKRPPICDECRWASYSIFHENTARHRLVDITKLPKNKHLKYVAKVEIGLDSGVALAWPRDAQHYSFWMYKDFAAHKAVISVDPIDG